MQTIERNPVNVAAPRDRTVLVTGASSGIGRDLAEVCAAHGHDLVLVARSQAALDAVAHEFAEKYRIAVTPVAQDLTAPDAAQRLSSRLAEREIQIDILINNAGLGMYGPFADSDLERELQMVQLNVVTLTALTKLALKPMLARKHGRILNVASTAAFQPGPLMAVYYATKAYVLSLSEALSNELTGSGVTVTALCPGPTGTNFQSQAKMEDSKLVRGRQLMTPAEVARAGYAGMLAGRTLVVPGFRNKLLANSPRFLPRSTVAAVVRRVQERVPSE